MVIEAERLQELEMRVNALERKVKALERGPLGFGGILERLVPRDVRDHLGTARRELLEETGYVAGEWIYLTTIHPTVAYSTERILVYLARGLEHRGGKLDEGEFLEVLKLTPAALLDLVRAGEISDVKTVMGVLWLEKLLRGEWVAGPALP